MVGPKVLEKKVKINSLNFRQVWYFSIISVALCSISIVTLVVSDIVNRENELNFALYEFLITTASLIPSLINMVVQFQYSNYALIIRSRYEALNRYLETILEEGVGIKMNGKVFGQFSNKRLIKMLKTTFLQSKTFKHYNVNIVPKSLLLLHEYC